MLFIALVFSLATFYGCPPNDKHGPCTDPQLQFWVDPSNYWMISPFKIGDSIKYRVYFKDKSQRSKYIYRNDAVFIMHDSSTIKVNVKNNDPDGNCNNYFIDNNRMINFTGPEKLRIQLDAEPLTDFDIFIRDRDFGIGTDQFNYHKVGWYDNIKIGGNNYQQVKYFIGLQVGGDISTYIDSTYCFYNLQYGILKMVINDTLIYERKLH